MSLILDTCVLIKGEKTQRLDLSRWESHKQVFISAATVSEMYVGLELANTQERKVKRGAFIEYVLASFPVLSFDQSVARLHARMIANVPKRLSAGVMDSIIAATAIHGGHAVLTQNVRDFELFAGLQVIEWTAPVCAPVTT